MRNSIITILIATLLTTSIVGPAVAQSNDVEWSGEVQLEGNPATDGAQFSYGLSDSSKASNFSIDVTGSVASASASASGRLGGGESASFEPGGNLPPTDGTLTVENTGPVEVDYPGENDTVTAGGGRVVRHYSGSYYGGRVRLPNAVDGLDSVTMQVDSQGMNYIDGVDVYVAEGWDDSSGQVDASDAQLVKADWTGYPGDAENETTTLDFDTPADFSSAAATASLIFRPTGGGSTGTDVLKIRAMGDSPSGATYGIAGDTNSESNPAVRYEQIAPAEGVSLSSSADSLSVGNMTAGESVSEPFDVTSGADSLSVSADSGTVDYLLEWTERTETRDPTVEINGHETSHSGTLADGETVSLSPDTAWLEDGTNHVNVSMSTPSIGPTPGVGLDYRHTARDSQTVEYSGETWSERYNVSKSFAGDRADASLTIPFASDRVVAIRNLERRVGGGSWSTVPAGERSLEGSSLSLALGDVAAGEQIDVRATGSKVRARNGEISVQEPTMLGEPLNTKIALESVGDEFGIQVNNTGRGGELHYTHSESWQNPQAFARFGSQGQTLRFPNAGSGSVARISTIDMGVAPTGENADVRVLEDGEEPTIQLRESSNADRVAFEYRETTSGNQYQLYSVSSELERDTATAESPVTLISPGVPETLRIYDLGSATGGGDRGGVVGPTAERSFGANTAFIIGAAVAGLIALFLVARRFGDGGVSTTSLFGVGAVVIVLVVLQVLAPNILADYLGRAVESAFPLLLLAGAAIGIVWLRQRGDDNSIIIQGRSK